ncbi:chemotaxis protein CheB [Methylobacterium oryzae CBMB20]
MRSAAGASSTASSSRSPTTRIGRSIAVALAGTDGDGTLGFKAIKEAGGLTLAEVTDEARAGELASSNTPAALADAVLPLDALVERVASAARQLATQGTSAPAASKRRARGDRRVLRNRTGHDFHGYKSGTFLRRVQRRMQVLSVAQVEEYVEVLRSQPEEAQGALQRSSDWRHPVLPRSAGVRVPRTGGDPEALRRQRA